MGRKAFRKSIKIAAGRAPPKSLGCAMMCDTASCPGVGRDRPPANPPRLYTTEMKSSLLFSPSLSSLSSLLFSLALSTLLHAYSIRRPNFWARADLRQPAHNIYIYIRKHYCIYKKKNATPLFDRSSYPPFGCGDTSPTATGPKRTTCLVYTTTTTTTAVSENCVYIMLAKIDKRTFRPDRIAHTMPAVAARAMGK